MTETAPYGSWRSPITLDMLVGGVVNLAFPRSDDGYVYFAESRPAEGGRSVIVRSRPDGSERRDLFGEGFNARTTVHEYGGRSYTVKQGTLYFSNFADQRLYRVEEGGEPVAMTAEPERRWAVRYAAPVVSPDGRHLYAVRERHFDPDVPTSVLNDVVELDLSGGCEPRVLAAGRDFYSHVACSSDGRRLAFTAWDHPNMPWDETELYELDLEATGEAPRLVAGGPAISVTQAKYSPAGVLHYCSDESGYWNIYADEDCSSRRLVPLEAEMAVPDWIFGRSCYTFLPNGDVLCVYSEGGTDHLGVIAEGSGELVELRTDYSDIEFLEPGPDGSVVAVAASPTRSPAVVTITPSLRDAKASVAVVTESRKASVEEGYLSVPLLVEFPTERGLTAYCFYYPPTNADFEAPTGELPPLVVASHGGPTAFSPAVLAYSVQFWTSRGFAVVDVNYGGSTNFGRSYRERLKGQWGIVDVEDCLNAARHLVTEKLADGKRLVIHGGSAGGYTSLCAITFADDFAAAASYFGVADARALATETHKFESRYLDGMIGPLPEASEIYEARSPVLHTDQLTVPLILFQGLEDKVVPPQQAEMMAGALAERGIPHAYVAYEGEQHGFRKAENIRRTSEAELYFYGRILGFTPADTLEPVEIVGLD